MTLQKIIFTVAAATGLLFAAPPAWAEEPKPATETNCSDRIDEDGDTVTDCADADCYDNEVCKTAGGLENTDTLCSDWIDNDGDGAVDCEDMDCQSSGIRACQGSWQGPLSEPLSPCWVCFLIRAVPKGGGLLAPPATEIGLTMCGATISHASMESPSIFPMFLGNIRV